MLAAFRRLGGIANEGERLSIASVGTEPTKLPFRPVTSRKPVEQKVSAPAASQNGRSLTIRSVLAPGTASSLTPGLMKFERRIAL